MVADKEPTLAGARVLVTRPAHQADGLCKLIERAGGVPVRFPTIEIAAPRDPAALERIVKRIDEFDLAIFVSPNAVFRAMRAIQARGASLPAKLSVACVGNGSAAALAQFDQRRVIVPDTSADSEGLLAMPTLQQVSGKRVVIFRGENGRELLAESLVARGANVEHAECYRRARPDIDTAALARTMTQSGVDVVTITSADALRNLYDMLDTPGRDALIRAPIVTVSKRLREACRTLGLRGPTYVAETPSDDAMITALSAWRGSQKTL